MRTCNDIYENKLKEKKLLATHKKMWKNINRWELRTVQQTMDPHTKKNYAGDMIFRRLFNQDHFHDICCTILRLDITLQLFELFVLLRH